MMKTFLVAALVTLLVGCSNKGYKMLASGAVGCSPQEISISNKDEYRGGYTYTATCKGVKHYCTVVGDHPIYCTADSQRPQASIKPNAQQMTPED